MIVKLRIKSLAKRKSIAILLAFFILAILIGSIFLCFRFLIYPRILNSLLGEFAQKISLQKYYQDSPYKFTKITTQTMWWLGNDNKNREIKNAQALVMKYPNAQSDLQIKNSFINKLISQVDSFFISKGFTKSLFMYSSKSDFINDLIYAYEKNWQKCEFIIGPNTKYVLNQEFPENQDATIIITCAF